MRVRAVSATKTKDNRKMFAFFLSFFFFKHARAAQIFVFAFCRHLNARKMGSCERWLSVGQPITNIPECSGGGGQQLKSNKIEAKMLNVAVSVWTGLTLWPFEIASWVRGCCHALAALAREQLPTVRSGPQRKIRYQRRSAGSRRVWHRVHCMMRSAVFCCCIVYKQ